MCCATDQRHRHHGGHWRHVGAVLIAALAVATGCRDAVRKRVTPDDGARDASSVPDGGPGAGQLLWMQPDDGYVSDEDVVSSAFDDDVALLVSRKGIRAVRAADGTELWRTTEELLHPAGMPRPLFEVRREGGAIALVQVDVATGARGRIVALPPSFNTDARLYLDHNQLVAVRDTSIRTATFVDEGPIRESWAASLDTDSAFRPVITASHIVTALPVVALGRTDGVVAWRVATEQGIVYGDGDSVAIAVARDPWRFVRVGPDGERGAPRGGRLLAAGSAGIAYEDAAGLWRWPAGAAAPTLAARRTPGEDFSDVALDDRNVYFFSTVDRSLWRTDSAGGRVLLYRPQPRVLLNPHADGDRPPSIDAPPVPRGAHLYVRDQGWRALALP